MGNFAESSNKDYQQRVLEARQLAEISGLDFKAIFDCFLTDSNQRGLSLGKTGTLRDFNPEQTGFKADVDHLCDWDREESSQYLFNNIFCFK